MSTLAHLVGDCQQAGLLRPDPKMFLLSVSGPGAWLCSAAAGEADFHTILERYTLKELLCQTLNSLPL